MEGGDAAPETKANDTARMSSRSGVIQEWIQLLKEVQFRSFIENQTFATVGLFVVSFCQTFLAAIAGRAVASQLVLSPAAIGLIDFRIWTLLTASYFERSLIKYIFMIGVCMPCAYHVEKVWGWKKFAPYVVAVNLASTFASSGLKVFLYLILDENYLFATIYGLGGVLMSLLVALTITCGDRLTPLPPIQIRHVPLAFFLISFMIHTIVSHVCDFFLTAFALWFSVAYLIRFPIGNNVGDMTIDYLFPTVVRPYILAATLLVCRNRGASNQTSRIATPSPMPRAAASDPVSERRRARALKALDQKLAEISNEPEISLDGDDLESNLQTT